MFSAQQQPQADPQKKPTPTVANSRISSALLKQTGLLDNEHDSQMKGVNRTASTGPHRTGAGSTRQSGTRPSKRNNTPDDNHSSKRTRAYERPKVAEKDTRLNIHPLAQRIGKTTRPGTSSKATPMSIRGASAPSDRTATLERITARRAEHLAEPKDTLVNALRGLVEKRYDPATQFLNLENLAQESIWKDAGITPPDSEKAARDSGAVLLKLARELKPPVQTISFANNRFTTLKLLYHMTHYLPNLRNLSFQGNYLTSSREVRYITGKQTPSALKELILLDNPFIANESNLEYRNYVIRNFPELVMLDRQPVVRIEFGVPIIDSQTSHARSKDQTAPTSFPVEMGPTLYAPGVDEYVIPFLTKFFPAFDADRASLVHAYSPTGTFSYSLNTTIPARARVKGFHQTLPNQKALQWTDWLPNSRNLSRVHNSDKADQLLSSSKEEIAAALEKIPRTAHNLGEGDKFVVDAWPVDGISTGPSLFVTVHGQFNEMPVDGIRSFDRTFILVAAPPGSSAQLNGWGVMIISDQLVVRQYSSHEAWKPGPMKTQAEAPATTSKQPAPIPETKPVPQVTVDPLLAQMDDARRTLVLQLKNATGLNTTFSIQCLEGNGWDYARALANFRELQAQLPPEAFGSN